MNLNVISCNVFRREMYAAAARSTNKINIEFLCQGLHDIGAPGMQAKVQEAIDAVTGEYDAICLGYGLCNNGLEGIIARNYPLVIPRAHDCITLFMGSKEKYLAYFNVNPGTYFKTIGWIESAGEDEMSQLSIQRKSGMDSTYEELVEKYGADNADFLYASLVQNTHFYTKFTYINSGVEPDDRWEKESEEEAKKRKWEFESLKGDMRLVQQLMDGEWDNEDFLVVPKGYRIITTHDDAILGVEEVV